jgi:hypothetical protein
VTPYATAGVSTSISLINSDVSVGFGPRLGIGIEYQTTPEVGLFFDIEGVTIFPGDAVDLADEDRNFDLFANAGFGVRYGI